MWPAIMITDTREDSLWKSISKSLRLIDSHVANKENRKTWTSLISKGRSEFTPNDGSRICSDLFKDGQQTTKNTNPALWLTIQDNRENKIVYKQIYGKCRGK